MGAECSAIRMAAQAYKLVETEADLLYIPKTQVQENNISPWRFGFGVHSYFLSTSF